MSEENAVEILIVEDTPEDLELALRALRKANLTNRIQIVRDGAEESVVRLREVFASVPELHRHLEGTRRGCDLFRVERVDPEDTLDVLQDVRDVGLFRRHRLAAYTVTPVSFTSHRQTEGRGPVGACHNAVM